MSFAVVLLKFLNLENDVIKNLSLNFELKQNNVQYRNGNVAKTMTSLARKKTSV